MPNYRSITGYSGAGNAADQVNGHDVSVTLPPSSNTPIAFIYETSMAQELMVQVTQTGAATGGACALDVYMCQDYLPSASAPQDETKAARKPTWMHVANNPDIYSNPGISSTVEIEAFSDSDTTPGGNQLLNIGSTGNRFAFFIVLKVTDVPIPAFIKMVMTPNGGNTATYALDWYSTQRSV